MDSLFDFKNKNKNWKMSARRRRRIAAAVAAAFFFIFFFIFFFLNTFKHTRLSIGNSFVPG